MRNAGIAKIIVVAAAALAMGACAPSKEEPSPLPPGTGPTPSVAPVPQVNTATPPEGQVTAKPEASSQECAGDGSEAEAGRKPSAVGEPCPSTQAPSSEAGRQGASRQAPEPAS